jgi:3-hydroxymyristoyl/3-hydroxydecanoyl-(acyl carrier protein) dehydratase
MTAMTYRCSMTVAADHPALPGHFPGRPIVPGVMLLEQVAHALRAWRGQRVLRVVEAKFVAPLLPQQTAEIELSEANGRTRFVVRHGDTVLARGVVEGAAP